MAQEGLRIVNPLEVFQDWGRQHQATLRFEGDKVQVEAEGITTEGYSIGTAVVEWERKLSDNSFTLVEPDDER